MAKKKRKVSKKFIPQASLVSDELYLPNHSGEHTAGTTGTPINARDIVNKAYADGLIGGATGSFTAGSGEIITVVNGMITLITTNVFLILLETGDSILMENDDRMENG